MDLGGFAGFGEGRAIGLGLQVVLCEIFRKVTKDGGGLGAEIR